MDEFSFSKRKKGKPNRGGGKFNRGRGRGKPSRDEHRHDKRQSEPDSKRKEPTSGGRGHSSGGRGYSSGGSGHTSGGRGYSSGGSGHTSGAVGTRNYGSSKISGNEGVKEVKVQMQRLHMSAENQDMVRDMLKNLHEDEEQEEFVHDNSDEDYEEVPEYDELDVRYEDQYWLTDNTLYVEDTIPLGMGGQTAADCPQKDSISPYALNKLLRYGYERQSCIEALQVNDGDLGVAYEYLFSQCFLEERDDEEQNDMTKTLTENGMTLDEVIEQRNEEMTALQSIYDENFTEKIPNKIWTLKFQCELLRDLIFKPEKSANSDVTSRKSEEICKFHLKGACRFGHRCRYVHDLENKNIQDVDDRHLKQEVDTNFELDLRFTKDNLYPLEPPYIGFSALDPMFPPYISLNITEHMYKEAKTYSESQLPIVFALVSLLEDEALLQLLVDKMPLESSLPQCTSPSWKQKELTASKPQIEKHSHGTSNDQDSDTEISEEDVNAIINTIESDVKEESDFKVERKRTSSRETEDFHISQAEVLKQNKILKDEFVRKKTIPKYKSMMSQRKKLPVWNKQDELLSAIDGHQVTVISGMTGCGKTTQVPQFILDSYLNGKGLHLCNMLCTQPRRISAMSVAERVAQERAEKLGRSVGYQIRLEKVQSSMTRLLFCTTGIVLRRLEGDPKLEGVSHIIIDEVHERSQESDFLIMYLRDVLYTRPDLKIILMSATLNADLFSAYFNGCPVIDIPGRTFPVDQYFLEDVLDMTRFVMEEKSPYARPLQKSNAVFKYGADYDDEFEFINNDPSKPAAEHVKDENLSVKQLKMRFPDYSKTVLKTMSMMDVNKINFDLVVSLLEFIVDGDHDFPNGSVLVFLQGFSDIQTVLDLLHTSPVFGQRNQRKYKIVPLHSSLSSEDQQLVFTKPPEGVTKIVIATNIAETSITIDDIGFVIDVGKMKEKRYDPSRGMESLDTAWVSRANAIQRKGRAGRVTHGVCFHLFTSHRYHNHLIEQPIPEILRAPLEQIVLRIKMLDIFTKQSPKEVLEQLLEPPEEDSILAATKRLQDLGALDEKNELTPLGYHLGSLPVDVRIGKLMLFGAIFRCLDPALTIAASLSFKSPFVSPFGKKFEATQKKLEFAVGNSDHLTMLNGYQGWLSAKKIGGREAYLFCQENFLSQKSLQMLVSLKQQFVELLSDIGFVREGITFRDVERAARRHGSDGVIELTGEEANINLKNLKLISAILVGALYPNVVQVMTPQSKFNQSSAGAVSKFPKPEELRFKTKSDGFIHIHPSSVNFQVRYYESPYLVYHEMVKTSKVYIRDSTMVNVYPLLLFGGGLSVDLDRGNFVLSVDDGWIRFIANSHQIAELVRELRTELDQLLTDKIKNPHMDLCTCPKGSKIIDTIVTLITTQ
ncbi:putative ATP-dependent RNA helicase DHX57 isoform X5 [Mytilus edulis]|uniref:putative ATP-dependent RNA helicase DHX57 isoform X1 n=1 Tax=Mytilus edulis TaxID=6550 RepID=UPI0039EE1EA6